MGSAMPFDDDVPFEEKVKCLSEEDLLEIWAESQRIETMINANLPPGYAISPNYENIIIMELTLRKNKSLAQGGAGRPPMG